MITARNYAAKAERSLRELGKMLPEYRHNLDAMARDISVAEHFVLPDGGRLFDDDYKGIYGVIVNLPYPVITIEYCTSMHKRGVCVVAKETKRNGRECIEYMSIVGELPGFNHIGIWDKQHHSDFAGFDSITWMQDQNEFIPAQYSQAGMSHKQLDTNVENANLLLATAAMRCILELCEALSCRNVTTEPLEKVDPKTNAKRIKAGKLPIYETRVLTIKTNQTVHTTGQAGSSHASPRQHLRRGHIRRLPSGNIWVNSCVVGDPSKGIIKKQYAVI